MYAQSRGRFDLRRLLTGLAILLACVTGAAFSQSVKRPASTGTAYVLQLNGAIGPASSSYLRHGLARARENGAAMVIIEMDTPGGLDTSMREIIKTILAMPMPVVSYVHPSGARAASAGTYILYASHIAAMTPGTNLGAATPIQVEAMPGRPEGDEGSEKSKPAGNASERKAVNDAVAFIRSLADMRGRNADWAEKAVREAASLPANAALQQNVVDIVARDRASLMAQLDGRRVTVAGSQVTLATHGIAVTEFRPDWTTDLLAAITDPNVALILMMVGIYGLIFEFMNPASFVPGTIGAIALLTGLYALAALPVDIAGLAFILLGMALMVGEAFVPSFGILGIGGLVAFMFGATILFDTDMPAFQVDWSVVAALGLFSFGLLILLGRMGLKSLRQQVRTGREEMIGAQGTVLDWIDGAGHVFVCSERWNAKGPKRLATGAHIVVDGIERLELTVSPASDH